MLRRYIGSATPFALVLSVAACSASPVPAQLPFAQPGVMFSVAPVGAGCTADGAYRGAVRWEVPAATSSKLEIQVGSDKPQVFARSNDPAGSEETGDWVSEGMQFVLRDRDSDMVLAALKAGPGNCGAAEPTTPGDAR